MQDINQLPFCRIAVFSMGLFYQWFEKVLMSRPVVKLLKCDFSSQHWDASLIQNLGVSIWSLTALLNLNYKYKFGLHVGCKPASILLLRLKICIIFMTRISQASRFYKIEQLPVPKVSAGPWLRAKKFFLRLRTGVTGLYYVS